MNHEPQLGGEEDFPWEDVDAARTNRRLQRKHPSAQGKSTYLSRAKPCPQCGSKADELAWFYFESPSGTWNQLCGRAGWITVCDSCRVQVDFFLEVLS